MNGRVAIITGASSGIGKAVALVLAEKGYDIGLGYGSNKKGAEITAREVSNRNVKPVIFSIDLSDPKASVRVLKKVIDKLGGVNIFVNNAGVNRRASILEETIDDWERVLTINATSPFLCAQTVARKMVEQGKGGRIINVTSVHETIPITGGSAYCASKAALGNLTRVMALELAPFNITVNSVSPGETATPMNGVSENMDVGSIKRPNIPAGRPGRVTEVAGLIAYLVEPSADYITGTSLTVDGGLSLMSAIANQEHANTL